MLRAGLAVALVLVLVSVLPAGAQPRAVILATTTSTQDSGLLDVLVPMFERRSGYPVKTIAVGTGQALALAARGEADVALAHAPALERRYVAEGRLVDRRLVMSNDFVVAGPADDPARIKGVRRAAEAFRAIAAARARFVSRGDNSGTHLLEQSLWRLAGVEPGRGWYIEAGQGMGATLGIADDRNAYALADRGTYLAFRTRVRLAVLVEGDPLLVNVYAVTRPAPAPRVNAAGGKAFADFLVSRPAQAAIGTFGADRYGQALFTPIAGRGEDQITGTR